MRKITIFIFILIVFGITAFAGYQFLSTFSYTRHITLPPHLLASSTDASSTLNATSTPDHISVFGSDVHLANPASSTVDTSSWIKYSNKTYGYSVFYPKDFTVNQTSSTGIVMFVPKDHYFDWPLLDDAKIIIDASSTCPEVTQVDTSFNLDSVDVNGYAFSRTEGSGVGAGNIYRGLSYDHIDGNICYHIELFDHGANGAGLYVSDQSLITKYEAVHQTDLDKLVGIFGAIVNSFQK